MKALATATALLLLMGLVGSRPCSCEVRQKLAEASEDAESHSCCHSSEPGPEAEDRDACIGCESCGAEREAAPGCGGQVATAAVFAPDERSAPHLLPAVYTRPDFGGAPVSLRGDALEVAPRSRRAVLSTVMLC